VTKENKVPRLLGHVDTSFHQYYIQCNVSERASKYAWCLNIKANGYRHTKADK